MELVKSADVKRIFHNKFVVVIGPSGKPNDLTKVTMELVKSADVKRIFHNKFVVVIGDSIQRSIYKDIVLLLQQNRLLQNQELKSKGEHEFMGDKLIEGGRMDKLTNGKDYREVRQYQTDVHLVRFYFITRCYSKYMQTVLADLAAEPTPDVIIMTSCLWDISRYGPYGMREYQKNLQRFFHHLGTFLSTDTLFVWTTTMPISSKIRGGFLLDYISFMQETLRLDIIEANFFAAQVISDYGHDVLDLHYNFRHLQHHRVKDGVHWNSTAHRYVSQLLLDHIARAWHLPLTTKQTFKLPNVPRKVQCVNEGATTRNFPQRPLRRKQRSISCCPAILNEEPLHFGNKYNRHVHNPANNRYPPICGQENIPPSRMPNAIASDRGFWMDEPLGFDNGNIRVRCAPNGEIEVRTVTMGQSYNSASSAFEKCYDRINCNDYNSTWDQWGWSENVSNLNMYYNNPRNEHHLQENNYNFNGHLYNQQENSNWNHSQLQGNHGNYMYNGMGEQYHARESGPMRRKRLRPIQPYYDNHDNRHVRIHY